MRVENPMFALTAAGAASPPPPAVTAHNGQQTSAPPTAPDSTGGAGSPTKQAASPPPPAAAATGGDNKCLVTGGSPEVIYWRGWSVRRSRLWQVLASIFLALFLIMVVIAASRSHSDGLAPPPVGPATPTPLPQQAGPQACENLECVTQAADVLQLMNLSANPCTDFFQYACGNFENFVTSRQFSRKLYTLADWLQDTNEQRAEELLMREPADADRPPPESAVWKLRTFHASCRDEHANLGAAGKRMVAIINDLGGLDLLGTFDNSSWNFNTTFQRVHSQHWTDAMMNFLWVRDPLRPGTNMLRIKSSGMGIPYLSAYLYPARQSYSQMVLAYRTTMSAVMAMLARDAGLNSTKVCGPDCLQTFADDVWDIESRLANMTTSRVPRWLRYGWWGRRRRRRRSALSLRRSWGAVRVTLAQLQLQSPQVDWRALFDELMGAGLVSDSTPAEVPRGSYVQNLGRLIQHTPVRALQHYLVWTMVRRHLMAMGGDYVYQKLRLDQVIRRSRRSESRHDYCLRVLDRHMPEAMGQLFVRHHIGMETVRRAANWTLALRDALSSSLRPWMTDAARYQADRLLANITFHYGYPKWILDEQQLDDYYAELAIADEDFFSNMKAVDVFQRQLLRRRLRAAGRRQRWTIDATHTRLVTSVSSRDLAVPAGMMRPPLFGAQLPESIASGALGTILAEHLALFTVTNNETYGKAPRTSDWAWWDSLTATRYRRYRNCVLHLYRNQTLPPGQLRPELASAALISRHYGLWTAWLEHRRRADGADVRPTRLPGLRHTSADQTFFLAFAQARCATPRSSRLEYLLHRLTGKVPARIEVNTAVYNSEQFRAAYQCRNLPPVYDRPACRVRPDADS